MSALDLDARGCDVKVHRGCCQSHIDSRKERIEEKEGRISDFSTWVFEFNIGESLQMGIRVF